MCRRPTGFRPPAGTREAQGLRSPPAAPVTAKRRALQATYPGEGRQVTLGVRRTTGHRPGRVSLRTFHDWMVLLYT
ncbi:hypothetical protein VTN02DRAFT_6724 [Thermoascus thermophilus]